MLNYKSVLIPVLLAFTACSSGPSVKVVERSDSKPSWATITRTSYEDGGKMRFVGYFTGDADARPSAIVNGSGTKARSMPLQSIVEDYLEQNGVAEDMKDSSSKLVISSLRKTAPNIPGLTVVGSYYERVEIQSSDGTSRTEIRGFSLAECPVAEFNTAKQEALKRLKGDPQIKKELDSIMAQQREHALSGDRAPASDSN